MKDDGVTVFNLDLFLRLNEEYAAKSPAMTTRKYDPDSLRQHADKWAEKLDKRMGVSSRRVLEVGCGSGMLSAVLAEQYNCEVLGVDILQQTAWTQYGQENLALRAIDLSQGHDLPAGSFDRIVSLVTWEHVKHPFSLLGACRDLLRPDGMFYLRANLYRSSIASHRYRDVFFPWPHLLFQDSVFVEFYRHLGKKPKLPSWVNKLTYAEYRHYFSLLGFDASSERLTKRPLDEEFYNRFENLLARYPKFDLTLDFFDVILEIEDPRSKTA